MKVKKNMKKAAAKQAPQKSKSILDVILEDAKYAKSGYGLLNEAFGGEDNTEGLDEFTAEDEAPEEDVFGAEEPELGEEGDAEDTVTISRAKLEELYAIVGEALGYGAEAPVEDEVPADEIGEEDPEGEEIELEFDEQSEEEEEEEMGSIFEEDEEVVVQGEQGAPTRKRANTTYDNSGTVKGTAYSEVSGGQATPSTRGGAPTRQRANGSYENGKTVPGRLSAQGKSIFDV